MGEKESGKKYGELWAVSGGKKHKKRKHERMFFDVARMGKEEIMRA